MKYSIKAFIKRDEGDFLAECLEVEAFARGKTLDETVEKLRHEICKGLAGVEMSSLDLVEEPTLFLTFEDEPIVARPVDCPVTCILEDNA